MHGFFVPHLSEEILEETNGEELARATAIPEAKWRIPGIVAHWIGLVADTRVHGAKRTVGDRSLSAILDSKDFPAEGALGQPDLLASNFVVLFTRRSLQIAIRVEVIRGVPVKRVSAGFRMRRQNGAGARGPSAKSVFLSREH
jgi:hypothetical protein